MYHGRPLSARSSCRVFADRSLFRVVSGFIVDRLIGGAVPGRAEYSVSTVPAVPARWRPRSRTPLDVFGRVFARAGRAVRRPCDVLGLGPAAAPCLRPTVALAVALCFRAAVLCLRPSDVDGRGPCAATTLDSRPSDVLGRCTCPTLGRFPCEVLGRRFWAGGSLCGSSDSRVAVNFLRTGRKPPLTDSEPMRASRARGLGSGFSPSSGAGVVAGLGLAELEAAFWIEATEGCGARPASVGRVMRVGREPRGSVSGRASAGVV
mmetsp:Transcript_22608/g.70013  ORF Transcript_22608/g.70013 Transcript_22608/m.70013 type:complete len:263 (-) Transcript_22608:524-1312(-)